MAQDIKKSGKNEQMGACKIQAKDLVRTRRYVTEQSAWLRLEIRGLGFKRLTIDSQVHPEVPADANTITSHFVTHSGREKLYQLP